MHTQINIDVHKGKHWCIFSILANITILKEGLVFAIDDVCTEKSRRNVWSILICTCTCYYSFKCHLKKIVVPSIRHNFLCKVSFCEFVWKWYSVAYRVKLKNRSTRTKMLIAGSYKLYREQNANSIIISLSDRCLQT